METIFQWLVYWSCSGQVLISGGPQGTVGGEGGGVVGKSLQSMESKVKGRLSCIVCYA
jgi:hypothetical protein